MTERKSPNYFQGGMDHQKRQAQTVDLEEVEIASGLERLMSSSASPGVKTLTLRGQRWITLPRAIEGITSGVKLDKRMPFLGAFYKQMFTKHCGDGDMVNIAACLHLIDPKFYLRDIPFPKKLLDKDPGLQETFRFGDCDQVRDSGIVLADLSVQFDLWQRRFYDVDKKRYSVRDALCEDFALSFFKELDNRLSDQDSFVALVEETRFYEARRLQFTLEDQLDKWEAKDSHLVNFARAMLADTLNRRLTDARHVRHLMTYAVEVLAPKDKSKVLEFVKRKIDGILGN